MAILDATLREGEQRYGVYFDQEIRTKIAKTLLASGIEEVELGVIKEDKCLQELWQEVANFSAQISFWCRLKETDIRLATSLFKGSKLNLSIPVSNTQLEKKLQINPSDLVVRLKKLLPLATKHFDFVSLGLEDASRAEQKFLFTIIAVAREEGVKRIRLSDTLGWWDPLSVVKLVQDFKSKFPELELSIHAHNDFGLATANALTALQAGANWVDTCLLGLGERAGLAALEEVTAYLYFRKQNKKYDLPQIVDLSKQVAAKTGTTYSEFKPILGQKLFFCETGLHVEALYKARETYEPFPPEKLGLNHYFALGAKSGLNAIKSKLAQLGFELNPAQLKQLVPKIKELSLQKKRPLTDQEIKELVTHVLLQ